MTHSIKTLFVTIMACIACNTLDAQTQIIAHRGYWDTAGSAQNSITSLKLADKIGCYGSEFDVHLTKDNKIVVFHDDDVHKVAIQTHDYKTIKKFPLKNGETIPTLDEYLEGCQAAHDTPHPRNQTAVQQESRGQPRGPNRGNGEGQGLATAHGVHLVQQECLRASPSAVSGCKDCLPQRRLGPADLKGKGHDRHRLQRPGAGPPPRLDKRMPRPGTDRQCVDRQRPQRHRPMDKGRRRLHHDQQTRGSLETGKVIGTSYVDCNESATNPS